jgi:2-polyprenyl-3-methyl-5-hydroxy-6-metoxy-1,4-benzoquinol methylase
MSLADSEYAGKKPAYFGAARREMLGFVPVDARTVLDIGCGDGSFGALLKERQSCSVTGLEFVGAVADTASTRLDRVVVGSAEDVLPFAGETFDCVVCNDVLEHLVDPWAAVRRFASMLTDEGCIVASVPNVRHFRVLKGLLQDKTWAYVDKGVLDRTHLRFFTVKTIPGLFEPAGLHVETLVGINGPRRFPLKYALLNWLTLGSLEDARYLQFACVARKGRK